MFPTDGEFLLLYGSYVTMLIILVIGSLLGKRKGLFKKNMIVFLIYSVLMIILFSNEKNFQYGSSLVMLFLGAVLILSHFVILLLLFIISLKRG